MQIPAQFQLFGRTVTVIQEPRLMGAEDVYGKSSYRDGTIRLQAPTEGLHDAIQCEQTFCHELVHWILNVMSEKELCGNEQFVDTFGQLLHQALTSGKALQVSDEPALAYTENPLGVRLGAHAHSSLLPLMGLQELLRRHGWLLSWKKIDQNVSVGTNGVSTYE